MCKEACSLLPCFLRGDEGGDTSVDFKSIKGLHRTDRIGTAVAGKAVLKSKLYLDSYFSLVKDIMNRGRKFDRSLTLEIYQIYCSFHFGSVTPLQVMIKHLLIPRHNTFYYLVE